VVSISAESLQAMSRLADQKHDAQYRSQNPEPVEALSPALFKLPARQLERDAAYGPQNNELKRAAFRNMYFDPAKYPEARLLYIEHLTRDSEQKGTHVTVE
jgi:tryptophan 2,3-dioxygenase